MWGGSAAQVGGDDTAPGGSGDTGTGGVLSEGARDGVASNSERRFVEPAGGGSVGRGRVYPGGVTLAAFATLAFLMHRLSILLCAAIVAHPRSNSCQRCRRPSVARMPTTSKMDGARSQGGGAKAPDMALSGEKEFKAVFN